MTPEELLKPRYKVIADYPFRDHFMLNEVVELTEFDNRHHLSLQEWYISKPKLDGTGTPTNWFESTFNKYPHLFKKLEWWEDREEKDMPEYVTNSHVKEGYHFIEKTGVFKVVSKGSFLDENMHVMYNIRYGSPHYCIIEGHRDTYNYSNFFPSTEEEYLNQNKTTL